MTLPRKSGVIHLTSATALDTVAGRITNIPLKKSAPSNTLGCFFVLIKIDDIEALAPWIEPFATFLEETYTLSCREPETTVDKALTLTRQKGRKKLQQLISETKTIDLNDVSYCFGVVRKLDVFLTHVGDIQAYLLHSNKRKDGSLNCHWINITEIPETTNKNRRSGRKDSGASLVTGTVQLGDTLFICTESIIDALGLKKLERILIDTPIDGGRVLIERELKNVSSRVSFGALLLRPERPPYGAKATTEAVTSSMTNLLTKQTETASLIDPEASPTVKKIWKILPSLLKNRNRTATNKTSPVSSIQDKEKQNATSRYLNTQKKRQETKTESKGKQLGKKIRQITLFLKYVGIKIIHLPWLMVNLATQQPADRRRVRRYFGQKYEAFIEYLMTHFRSLPRSSQRLFIIALLFGYLFVQSLVYLADRQIREQVIEQNNQLITDIQERLDQAESSIIFGNDIETAAMVTEASNLLQTFPEHTRRQKEQRQLLKQSIDSLRRRLEKIMVINDPKIIATLTNTDFINASGLLMNGKTLLLYRADNNTFATIDSGSINPRPVTSANINRINKGKIDDRGRLVFLTNGPAIAVLNLDTNSLSLEAIEDSPTEINDFAFYNGRLYILNAPNNQIYRFQKSAAGYRQPTPWVNGNVPTLGNGASLAIDGNIYVLGRDLTITKLFSGNKQNWSAIKPLSPSNKARRLITRDTSDFLYALDSETNRIIVWDKENGKIKHQLDFPSLKNITDFTIDSRGQYLYVLADEAVVQTSILR